jgi:hypothetical protein
MAIQIGIGLSIEKNPLQAVREAVRLARINLGTEKIDLAIVFSSIEFAHSNILKTIADLLDQVSLIGCSSLGIITNQGIFKYGIAIMLLSLAKGTLLNTASVKEISADSALSAGEDLGERLLYGFRDIHRDFGLIFSDGLIEDGHSLLSGLQERLGQSFPLIGASSSDNLSFKRTFQYINDEALSNSACGILFGGKLNFSFGIKHGWNPIGKPRYVTKSKGNIVYEIDGIAAVRMYEEYFSSDLIRLRKELKRISIFYPIGVYLAGEEAYILRNILSIDDDGALVFQGNIPEGSLIRLMIGTKESCLAATETAVDEVKNGLYGRQLSLVFVFDSVSRYMLLGRKINRELEIIKDGLGKDTPIIGIYTYGEQGPLKSISYHGRAHFHNQSIAILGFAN